MYRIVVNLQTGEQESIPLTAEEIAEIQNRPQPMSTPEPTAVERLAAIGLTVDDLKELLDLTPPVKRTDTKDRQRQ